MPWLSLIALAVAGIASMRAAMERGDVDEAARQGMLAGPAVVESALAAPDRAARLAAIAAAPSVAGRIELLGSLARAAAGPDRRIALPAAHAARTIARELRRSPDRPDDIADADLASWRDDWLALARRADRWIELRVIALDVAIALDPALDLTPAIADPDPAFRSAAIAVVPAPVPDTLRTTLATIVAKDPDDRVALAAAAVLCFDVAAAPSQPLLDALGAAGLDRLRSLATGKGDKVQLRDAARCLARRR